MWTRPMNVGKHYNLMILATENAVQASYRIKRIANNADIHVT